MFLTINCFSANVKSCWLRKSGTGGIYELNHHLYEDRYTPTNAHGKQESHNVYAKTREECEKLLEEMIVKIRTKLRKKRNCKKKEGRIMKAHIPSGHAIIFVKTNFSEVKSVDEQSLTDIQKQCYSAIRKRKNHEGYGTIILDLQTREKICEFNMENYRSSKEALDRFARAILPDVKEHFSKEENRRKYEQEKIKCNSKFDTQ